MKMGENLERQQKHAMILTAYNDFEILAKLLRFYSENGIDCYVHVDKKSIIPDDFMDAVCCMKNVSIFQKYIVNWGGYGHVSAVFYLLKRAKQKRYDYYHILSANTFPCQNIENICRFFSDDKIYIEMFGTDGDEECRRREKQIYLTNLFESTGEFGKKCNYYLHRIQTKLKIERKQKYQYKGYFYCHLPDYCVEWCINWLKRHPSYQLRLKTTAIPEEFFFQNMISQSPYLSNVECNCLIYSKWKQGDKGPAVLGIDECKKAVEHGDLFVRKIRDSDVADWLIEQSWSELSV